MRAVIETQVVLDEPSADQGLVTWFEVRILEGFEGADDAAIGRARVARVHVGQALDVGESLLDVLDADSGELEAIYHVFFDEGGFRDEFVQGAGSDLLYVSEVRLEPGWEGRNIDLALVRRLCDTLGQGCEVAVIPCRSSTDGERWQRLGFAVAGSAKEAGYLYLPLGSRPARVAPNDDLSSYRVVANPPPGRDHH
jgi:hypothetical protein